MTTTTKLFIDGSTVELTTMTDDDEPTVMFEVTDGAGYDVGMEMPPEQALQVASLLMEGALAALKARGGAK